MQNPKIVVAMSGGVDSSVAAALLAQQGYHVTGVMLRLWNQAGMENENRCCTPDAVAQARRVAAILGIPFYVLDVKNEFYFEVVRPFVKGYQSGITPNPCIYCNRLIRWGVLLDYASSMGAEYMATGHYARLTTTEDGKVHLLKGNDPAKDQSYVLSGLDQSQLKHTLLPLGEYEKPAIREMAREFKFPVADRPDSQDLCFLAGEDYHAFLAEQAPGVAAPGKIVGLDGTIYGEHQGLAFYTIGQRKGIGVAHSSPLYVLKKDYIQNALVVGPLSQLGFNGFETGPVNWLSGKAPSIAQELDVKVRYKAEAVRGFVEPLDSDGARITFKQSLRDITPGQLAVFYCGDEVIGSGTILSAQAKPYEDESI